MFRLLLTLAAVVGLAADVRAQDVRYVQETAFTLAPSSEGAYKLSEDTLVEIEYLTDRAGRMRSHVVPDVYYAPVHEVLGWWNGDRIDREHVTVRTPQVADVFMVPGSYHVLTTPDPPRPGDEVSYRYQRVFDNVAYAPLLRVPDISRVERFTISVEHPADVEVSFDVFGPHG